MILFYFFTKKCLNFEIGNIYLFIISYFTNFCYKKKKIVYANYVLCLNVDIVKKMKKRKEKSMLWNSSFFFFSFFFFKFICEKDILLSSFNKVKLEVLFSSQIIWFSHFLNSYFFFSHCQFCGHHHSHSHQFFKFFFFLKF